MRYKPRYRYDYNNNLNARIHIIMQIAKDKSIERVDYSKLPRKGGYAYFIKKNYLKLCFFERVLNKDYFNKISSEVFYDVSIHIKAMDDRYSSDRKHI